MERRVCGQLSPQKLEVAEPLLVEAVGEICVLPVVDLISEEDDPPLVTDEPDAVVRRLPRPEVEHRKADATEMKRLPVRDRTAREGALSRPLLAEHRAQDLLLERVVSADHGVDPNRGDDGHLDVSDELDDASVVIGVRVRDEHRQERLAERLELCAEGAAVGDGQRAVDCDDPLIRLDEVGVDEGARWARRVAVDASLLGHAAASVGRPWRAITRS